MSEPSWILTLTCDDRVGIVGAIAGFLASRDGFILDSQQYADLETGRFFMRVVFKSGGRRFPPDTPALIAAFEGVATLLQLDWSLTEASVRPRVVVAVSKGSHCLNDLLHRRQTRALSVEIAAVVSNHESLRALAEWHGVPFHHLPVSDDREAQERAIEAVIAETDAQYLVLARYMQILSPDFARRLEGRCINIHHSFLPGFKGAKPYHRAHARGVKLIGATAHFVTGDLDEGPIIEQAVERIDHRASIDDMIRIGRDIEAQVLARAVEAIGERRVFLNDGKTVVFR
ncbi:formyltetrahydrofolate deformylase [Sphingomonas japonica]|uniref:Formyltetrahydrofolate deformylase n=1 Tax=Sphingomonas japonica TaxID=511662 RepID=A0ABX0U4X8_9SPHN|nr:formyltetrahydrofolate deformylase [Sphingomonas japonica]NIJ23852.1 formyltetrahydrofolate deformylase [Sphingomonas japonica]